MSDKRTDHKAEALESDNLTPEQWVTFAFETSDASNIYMAIRELKHATLYAAEQARIANLIALNATYQEMDGAMYSIGERLAGSPEWPTIAAALVTRSVMTPRVVRTVEELEGLPVGSVVRDDSGDVLEVLVIHGGFFAGRYLYSGRSADYDSQTVPLPATVLAPLSVTAKQVEAGRVALVDAMNYRGAVEDFEWDGFVEKSAEFITAALAAMGIPVVES